MGTPDPTRVRGRRAAIAIAATVIVVSACSAGGAPAWAAVRAAAPTPPASITATVATASPVAPPSAAVATPEATPEPTPSLVIVTPMPGGADKGLVVKLIAKAGDVVGTGRSTCPWSGWHVDIQQQEPAASHVVHDFPTVETGHDASQHIIETPSFRRPDTGPLIFWALPAGTYRFLCTIHPQEHVPHPYRRLTLTGAAGPGSSKARATNR